MEKSGNIKKIRKTSKKKHKKKQKTKHTQTLRVSVGFLADLWMLLAAQGAHLAAPRVLVGTLGELFGLLVALVGRSWPLLRPASEKSSKKACTHTHTSRAYRQCTFFQSFFACEHEAARVSICALVCVCAALGRKMDPKPTQ